MAFEHDVKRIAELRAALAGKTAAYQRARTRENIKELADVTYELGLLTTNQLLLGQAKDLYDSIDDRECAELTEKAMVLHQIK